jgi:hypothetical protein
MTKDALAAARELGARADRLLERTGLLGLLSAYGEVRPTGSFVYGLMTREEIDLCLAVPEPTVVLAFETGRRISGIAGVGSMLYRNELVLRTPGNPRGLLWCVDLAAEDGPMWKLDLLVADRGEVERVLRRGEELLARLDEETRAAILELKRVVCDPSRPEGAARSADVYEAVLDHGVRGMDDWRRWRGRARGITRAGPQ